jgi:hypothetical protein
MIVFQEADRIDMRAFRYGGVNVTYFIPKSSLKMNSSMDRSITDRLSLPSVRLLFALIGKFTFVVFIV